jgi:hypothetical protein
MAHVGDQLYRGSVLPCVLTVQGAVLEHAEGFDHESLTERDAVVVVVRQQDLRVRRSRSGKEQQPHADVAHADQGSGVRGT